MRQPRIQYAKTSEGVSIAYADMGEGAPIVWLSPPPFCHVQLDWEIYSSLTQELIKKHRLIWFDWPGTGLSERERYDFSMDAMIRNTEVVVNKLALKSFTVCALSDSVPIGVTYAVKDASRVSRLLLFDGWATHSEISQLPAYTTEYALRHHDWFLYTETLVRVLWGIDDDELARQMAAYLRTTVEPDAHRAARAAFQQWNVADLLEKIACPTLVAHNREARFTSPQIGQRMAAAIPAARFLMIEDLAYKRLAPIVDSFVSEERAPSEAQAIAFRTVLFTDVVGHTEMMQRLGDERGRAILRKHETITREVLKANGGTEVKTMGDGFMASFGSVTRAVECAIALQRAFAEREGEPLAVRVGLNAGEPIEEDGDLFGATVILASRIAAKAEGGEIPVADTVRGLCSGKGFLFADRGEFVAKRFEEPVRVYEVRWEA